MQFEFTCLTPPVFPALVTGINSKNGNLNCEGSTLHENLNTVAKEHWTSKYLMEHEIERFGKHYSYDQNSITSVVKETTFSTKKYTTQSTNVSSPYIYLIDLLFGTVCLLAMNWKVLSGMAL